MHPFICYANRSGFRLSWISQWAQNIEDGWNSKFFARRCCKAHRRMKLWRKAKTNAYLSKNRLDTNAI